MEDWISVNFIKSLKFTTMNKTELNKNQQKDFWLKILCDENEINWLVDTGRVRLFMSRQTAKTLTRKLGNKIINKETNIGELDHRI